MPAKTQTLLSCEEFEKLAPTLGNAELIDGEVIHLSPSGMPQGSVAVRIASLLFAHVEAHKLGHVLCNETGIHVNRKKRRTRGADVLFVSFKRVPQGPVPKGFMNVPPELIVEVFGEEDTWKYMNDKIKDYHEFGVDLVWVADPESRTVKCFPKGGSVTTLTEKDQISAGEALPGFSTSVARFFQQ